MKKQAQQKGKKSAGYKAYGNKSPKKTVTKKHSMPHKMGDKVQKGSAGKTTVKNKS